MAGTTDPSLRQKGTARIALRAVPFVSQAADMLISKEKTLTAHEALTALVWLVAGGYAVYLVWFLARSMREH